jgi:1,4-dihydroxy-2-naphthoate octaprenyltransferase
VISISYKLGYRGTFIFSASLFAAASIVLFLHYSHYDEFSPFLVFTIALLPAMAYFFYWAMKVFRNIEAADFKNSLLMNITASACTNIGFAIITILRH